MLCAVVGKIANAPLHLILVYPVLRSRSRIVTAAGIVAMILMVLIIALGHMIKDKKVRIWWHRMLSLLLTIFVVVHMVWYFVDFNEYQQNIMSIEIEDMELSGTTDGIYEGEYDAGYIYAKVRVEVADGKILSIDLLEHRNERGKKAERIIPDILKNQKLQVDAVSGATNSSKVIKKAIENALRKEGERE